MKKCIILILIFAAALLIAEENVALTMKVKGNVELIREDMTSDLEMGTGLVNSDELISGEKSFVAVRFVDGNSFVKLFSHSRLIINTYKKDNKYDKKSYLKMGNLWSKVTKDTGEYTVETPTTVVSVRGTEFVTKVSKDGTTRVYTVSGKVTVTDKKTQKKVTLGSGESAVNDGKNPLQTDDENWDDMPQEIIDNVEQVKIIELELKNSDGEQRNVEIEIE